MAEFLMPSLGADMTEGTVTRWLVAPGARVTRGDVIVEVETDKADMEVEVFQSGIVERILVAQGERVPVGTPLALIATGSPAAMETQGAAPPAAFDGPPATRRATPTAAKLAEEAGLDLAAIPGSGVGGTVTRRDVERAAASHAEPAARPAPAAAASPAVLASPRARKLARQLGIVLDAIRGSGPSGAITTKDVEAAAAIPAPAGPAAAPGPATPAEVPKPRGRGPIAALMARSNREIPHYFLGLDIDLTPALAWLEQRNAGKPASERILYSALLLKAVALAARDIPEMNGYWQDDSFEAAPAVNLGVAISLRSGSLVAPAIATADALALPELMSTLRDLVTRARSGRLRASEMSSGTITVTNLGELGVDAVYGVIFPPQVALVGFGRVTARPWAVDGLPGIRQVVTASLAADHRASDGHRGGQFLGRVEHYLKSPELL